MKLKEILDLYESASGQAINYNKSGIFFSRKVGVDTRGQLANVFSVHNPLNNGHYLGLSSLVGRDKKHIFNYVKERLFSKL